MAAVARRKGAESGEIKHLADSRECKEGVKERRVSAAQLWLTAIEKWGGGGRRGGGGAGGLGVWGAETQAKRLMWITVGQTSEEDKTANMSHCSLLAFNSRCFASSVLLMFPRPGCCDPMSVSICKYGTLPSLALRHLDRDGEEGVKAAAQQLRALQLRPPAHCSSTAAAEPD